MVFDLKRIDEKTYKEWWVNNKQAYHSPPVLINNKIEKIFRDKKNKFSAIKPIIIRDDPLW